MWHYNVISGSLNKEPLINSYSCKYLLIGLIHDLLAKNFKNGINLTKQSSSSESKNEGINNPFSGYNSKALGLFYHSYIYIIHL